MKLFFIVLLVISSCTFKKNQLINQTKNGHEELYSEPMIPAVRELGSDEKKIIITSTNDLHGKYQTQSINFIDHHNKEEQNIHIGGKDIIKQYFEILRKTHQNVLLVDSGDIFSTGDAWNEVKDFYSDLKYDALSVGLRDFNLKVPEEIGNNTNLLKKFSASSSVPLVLSNLYDLKTARIVEWKGTTSHLLKEVDGMKIGIIGLIPDDVVEQTPTHNRVGLYVENMLSSTLKHGRLLRSLGADIVVVLTQQGIDCSTKLSEKENLPVGKVNFDPKRNDICDLNSPLGTYLERLPPHLVDVVIGGRNHLKMANIINNIIVMGSFSDGKSFNYLELVVNTKLKSIVPEKSVIHQPVFFCYEFFKETNDCYYEDPSVNHKLRTPALFLGQEIIPTPMQKTSKINFETSLDHEILSKVTADFDVDLIYSPMSRGDTQLLIISLTGKELIKVLENEYNAGNKNAWSPYPYLFEEGQIAISISGTDIEREKEYRIMSDLESIQKNYHLIKLMAKNVSKIIPHYSWSDFFVDKINSKLAAQKR